MFQSRKLWQWVLVLALLAAVTAAFRAAVEADGEGWRGTIEFLIVSAAAALVALAVQFLQAMVEWDHLGEVIPNPRFGRGWKDRLKRFFTSFDPLD